ncbi:polyprenol reductase isoform X2 [Musca domestica]|nr:polyprenol reductase isoform X2 [Musca domestica]XP_058980731.1 polyprenol reductase isoform X2 [Musca domestica]
MSLMCLQCTRRFYETNFVQIFSKNNKISIGHYAVGYVHYFGTILTILANSEGFVGGSHPSGLNFSQLSGIHYVTIALFLFSWWHQYQSNLILVNLRTDRKTGKVITEKHLLPSGGFFDWISSPHMLFEVVLYVALLVGFMEKSLTWWLVVIWVTSNQIYNAMCTHTWYKQTFKNYPRKRKAIIPFTI